MLVRLSVQAYISTEPNNIRLTNDVMQPRKRTPSSRDALADAGTSVDGRDAGEEGQYGTVLETSLGLEGLGAFFQLPNPLHSTRLSPSFFISQPAFSLGKRASLKSSPFGSYTPGHFLLRGCVRQYFSKQDLLSWVLGTV